MSPPEPRTGPNNRDRDSENPAHELKNLLAVILGVCESLAEGGAGEQAELAKVGALAAEKAGALVNRIEGQRSPP